MQEKKGYISHNSYWANILSIVLHLIISTVLQYPQNGSQSPDLSPHTWQLVRNACSQARPLPAGSEPGDRAHLNFNKFPGESKAHSDLRATGLLHHYYFADTTICSDVLRSSVSSEGCMVSVWWGQYSSRICWFCYPHKCGWPIDWRPTREERWLGKPERIKGMSPRKWNVRGTGRLGWVQGGQAEYSRWVEHGAGTEKGWCWHLPACPGKLTLSAEVERELKAEAIVDLEAHSSLKSEEDTILISSP